MSTAEVTDARQLARELGCFLEEDLAALTNTTIGTLRNWRTQRAGPPFVVLGNRCLYPIAQARDWIEKNAEATLPAQTAFEVPQRGRRKA